MNKVSAFLNRKVAGVKVLYLLAVAAVALAVVAFVIKPKTEPVDEVSDTATDTGDDISGDDTGRDAGYLLPETGGGTVVVSPAPPTDVPNSDIQDNTTWVSKGVAFLLTKGVTGTNGQTALTTYLAGKQLSVTQRQHVDMVIAEYGLPPMGVEDSPSVADRRLVRYVKTPNASTIYAQYSDNTLHVIRNTEYVSLGRPAVTTVPTNDTIWTFPTYDASGSDFTQGDNPMNIAGWVRVRTTGQIYVLRQNGTISRTAESTWVSYGRPALRTIEPDDEVLKRPVTNPVTAARVTGYARIGSTVYQLWSDGSARKLTAATYKGLGSPTAKTVKPNSPEAVRIIAASKK